MQTLWSREDGASPEAGREFVTLGVIAACSLCNAAACGESCALCIPAAACGESCVPAACDTSPTTWICRMCGESCVPSAASDSEGGRTVEGYYCT